MLTREQIESYHTKYLSNTDFGDKPMLLNGPFSTYGRGTLWGGSTEMFIYEHQSFSRSGSSFITVTCFPSEDQPIFVETHAHHEGSDSRVLTLEQMEREMAGYEETIRTWVEKFEQKPGLENEPDPERKYLRMSHKLQDALLLYGMHLQTYEICKNYSVYHDTMEVPVQYPPAPEQLESKLY